MVSWLFLPRCLGWPVLSHAQGPHRICPRGHPLSRWLRLEVWWRPTELSMKLLHAAVSPFRRLYLRRDKNDCNETVLDNSVFNKLEFHYHFMCLVLCAGSTAYEIHPNAQRDSFIAK